MAPIKIRKSIILCTPYGLALILFVVFRVGFVDKEKANESHQQLLVQDPSLSIFSSSSIQKEIRIAIIGATGYIGSQLLAASWGPECTLLVGYDHHVERWPLFPEVRPLSSSEIPTTELQTYSHIIYLGGFTGRVKCDTHSWDQVLDANVYDIFHLAQRMLPSQTLLFASTSAIAEGHLDFGITDTPNITLLDTYSHSMFLREKYLSRMRAQSSPKRIGIRLGTVIGLAPLSQRQEYAYLAFVKSAFTQGYLEVSNPEAYRAIAWMPDMIHQIQHLISSENTKPFTLYHLQSTALTIYAMAAHVAQRLHIPLIISTPSISKKNSLGFSLKDSLVKTSLVNADSMLQTLITNAPLIILGRDSLDLPSKAEQKTCIVCGSKDLNLILDLHEQPLANDFFNTKEKALQAPKFPLNLQRCRQCHHTQLGTFVDRKRLFTDYTYRSGTSQTLKKYFKTLAEYINDQHPGSYDNPRQPCVLDIACNDGSQLDAFAEVGWGTYGVDAAANILELVNTSRGHLLIQGFWGSKEWNGLPPSSFEFPRPDFFEAIIAQNVLAHVEDPVAFVKACVPYMHEKYSKLYLQTSQCYIFFSGQFDTIYHEHISFFTAHSFAALARETGLVVVDWKIQPIHGDSCFIVMAKKGEPSKAFQEALDRETQQGLTQDWYYARFNSMVTSIQKWLLQRLYGHTLKIAAYGAAAKGMVLFQSLLRLEPSLASRIEFVMDDAPLKQHTYCPGTKIPVVPSFNRSVEGFVIIIFTWNFWNEIRSQRLKGYTYKALIPFPTPREVQVNALGDEVPESLVLAPVGASLPAWPFVGPKASIALIVHIYNEELLLPYFIQQHAPQFDTVIVIDYNSTDGSQATLQRLAPPTWQIVTSKNSDFGAVNVDREVEYWESQLPVDTWKIALTITEFVTLQKQSSLSQLLEDPNFKCLRLPAYVMTGPDHEPLRSWTVAPLIEQRYQGVGLDCPQAGTGMYQRFLHRIPNLKYTPGRHGFEPSAPCSLLATKQGVLRKYRYTPWPDLLPRKLQIASRIPLTDRQKGFGVQHVSEKKVLEDQRNQVLSQCKAVKVI